MWDREVTQLLGISADADDPGILRYILIEFKYILIIKLKQLTYHNSSSIAIVFSYFIILAFIYIVITYIVATAKSLSTLLFISLINKRKESAFAFRLILDIYMFKICQDSPFAF